MVHFEPRLLECYINDVFSITNKINTERFLTRINDTDPNIRFTIEREHESLLPFLDVIIKREDGQTKTSVYRKPIYMDQVVNFYSHHSSASKRVVVQALMDRVVSDIGVEDSKERGTEREKVIETLQSKG